MAIKHLLLTVVAGTVLVGTSPALAAVTIYNSESAFDAAISGAASYTPTANAFYANSYAFGPVTETAPFLDTYTGDYGPGVRSLGAFLSPVNFSSTQTALGLELGYFIGPQTATYTIDGVSRTIVVPDNAASPNSIFIGFTDTKPVTVSFETDSAEFDTLRVVSGVASAVPEPSTWALFLAGMGGVGLLLRRAKTFRSKAALTA